MTCHSQELSDDEHRDHARDKHRDSPYFDHTEEFCAKYDQTAFDAAYVSNPLEHYEPLIRERLQGR